MWKEFCMGLSSGVFFGALMAIGLIPYDYLFTTELWLVYLIFNLTIHFRHTHIPLSFGPYLSYIFSSPSMHQIHHSIEPRHLNKNYAIIFSIWDWLFKSLYIPKEPETFRIGLPDSEEQKKFQGLYNHLTIPFILAYRSVKKVML
jgi:sterol desaturase/sphingolipid hydroxylase (fatty acid hydroxylase superfamily)